MSVASCPVSGSMGGMCPVGAGASNRTRSGTASSRGPRGCSFSGVAQPGDIHAAFDVSLILEASFICSVDEYRSHVELMLKNGFV